MKHTLQAILFLLIFVLAACGGDDKKEDATTIPPEPATLLENAAAQLESATAFQLALQASGNPVSLDAEAIQLDIPIIFQQAQGFFVAPNSVQAVVSLMLSDVVTEVDMITVGNAQFLKHNFITGNQWQAMTFSPTFDPAHLTSGDQSIPAALRTLQGVEYIGETDLEGVEVYHIRAQVDAAKVSAVTVGLIGMNEGQIQADVYIRADSGRLERLELVEPPNPDLGTTEATIWQIALYDYNGEYQITQPDVAP